MENVGDTWPLEQRVTLTCDGDLMIVATAAVVSWSYSEISSSPEEVRRHGGGVKFPNECFPRR